MDVGDGHRYLSFDRDSHPVGMRLRQLLLISVLRGVVFPGIYFVSASVGLDSPLIYPRIFSSPFSYDYFRA